jgi:hypothetical protein
MSGLALLIAAVTAWSAGAAAPAPNGITMPVGYQDWRVIAVSHRTDNNSLRAILGNDVAIKAAREGHTSPWPDGTTFAKVMWKDAQHERWAPATVPGEFVQAEFMIKDAKKYAATGGWGFARWRGAALTPYGKDASFVQECFGCHIPMRDHDYVFTRPVSMP